LQEPLRTITSFTQLLVSRYRDQGGPDVAEFVSHIVAGVERMNSLIRDLLQYSSTGASKTMPTQPSSTESALAEVLFVLSDSIQNSGATITHDPLPDVWIDNRSLALLLQNLIVNAVKYRGPQPLCIQISAEAADDDWLFTVRDNGIGISPEYHERIFGIFKRLHGREVPGTGIGLAICQRIVQWHGGRIWVESESGSGAAFRFTVPRERQRIQRELAEFATLGALAS
jgi:light-regulated signal transduction histidine kinase (bacteriophytochrome)